MKRPSESGRIYTLIDPENGFVRYCGKTVLNARERLKYHLWSMPRSKHRKLYQWISELMERGLSPHICVVEEVSFIGIDRTEQISAIDDAERKWIARFREAGLQLLNMTSGGNGAHGVKFSPERIEKLRQANLGRVKSPETCRKISEATRARGKAQYAHGMAHPNWGIGARDPEAKRQKLIQAWKNEEKLAQQRERATKAWSSEKLRQEQSVRHRGEKNARAVITEDIAKQIFTATGSSRRLAKLFSVSRNIIMSVKKKRSWSWATSTIGE